jgi:hypothetical protein
MSTSTDLTIITWKTTPLLHYQYIIQIVLLIIGAVMVMSGRYNWKFMTVLFIAGVAAYGWITYYTVVNVIGISSFYQ